MKIVMFQFSLFGINTYVVYDPNTKDAAVIDPGMINEYEEMAMSDFISRENLRIIAILNTHLHIDHVAGNKFMKKLTGAPVMASVEDYDLGKMIKSQAAMFGLPQNFENVIIDHELHHNDTIKIGDGSLEVIKVPGHSRGSIAYYDKKDSFVVVGDALFHGSIGRTDLPGGDYMTLINSINENLLSLPGDTVVYPGHGDPTTIANEKIENPFLA